MTVEELINNLQKFDPKDNVVFYHLNEFDLQSCELESILKTDDDLGVEITIEEIRQENEDE
tara:strand:- start:4 stop:186 length:183 start_codon:yes stop_codon:yes gene_type:complete